MDKEYNIRDGRGIKWKMVTKSSMGISETSGFTIDNLDTKEPADAASKYESVFISIRKTIEQHSSLCMDVESERLNLCQAITDSLKKQGFIPR